MSQATVSERISEHFSEHSSEEGIAAELEAYNRAFLELELTWRWDGPTFRDLLRIASDRDFVGAYVEHKQPHLLRVYEKSFLRDLVLSAKDRCQRGS